MGMGLITLLLTVGPLILAGTFNSAKKSTSTSKLREIGVAALNTMVQKIKFSRKAECGVAPYYNSVKITDANQNVITFYTETPFSLKSKIQIPGSTETDWISFFPDTTDLIISECQDGGLFSCSGQTVKICFNLSTNKPDSDPGYSQTKLETQVTMRNADL